MLKDTIIFTFNDIKKEGVEKQQTTPPSDNENANQKSEIDICPYEQPYFFIIEDIHRPCCQVIDVRK